VSPGRSDALHCRSLAGITIRRVLLLALLVGAAVAIPIHVLTMFACGLGCGIRAETVSIGCGPRLLRRQISGTSFELHLLPLGGYVKFESADFERSPIWARVCTNLSGCALLLALGAVLGGWIDPRLVWRSFPALALHPRTQGADVFIAYATAFSATPFAAVGKLCCVLAAANLLPLPNLNGGDVILAFISRAPDPPTWLTVVRYTSFVIMLGLMISLLIAIVSAAWPAHADPTTTSTDPRNGHLLLQPAP
jgi:hypothetical protein